jgi:hypothetical protein
MERVERGLFRGEAVGITARRAADLASPGSMLRWHVQGLRNGFSDVLNGSRVSSSSPGRAPASPRL